jgi:hypothetical protein
MHRSPFDRRPEKPFLWNDYIKAFYLRIESGKEKSKKPHEYLLETAGCGGSERTQVGRNHPRSPRNGTEAKIDSIAPDHNLLPLGWVLSHTKAAFTNLFSRFWSTNKVFSATTPVKTRVNEGSHPLY